MELSYEEYADLFVSLCSNASESNESSELWLIPDSDKTSGLVTAVFMLLIVVLALPLNLLVVGIILKEKLFKQPTIVLLLNLVLTDLMVIVLIMPFQIATGLQGEFRPGLPDAVRCLACDVGLTTCIFALMSLGTVTLMSFDRFLFIYKPLHYDRIVTSLRVLIALLVMWVVSVLLAILPLVGFGEIIFFSPYLSCSFDFTFTTNIYPIVILVLVSLLVMATVIFNLWVVVIVQRNIRAIYRSWKVEGGKNTDQETHNKHMKKKRHEKQLHLLKVFGGLLCSNLVTWLPLMCVGLYAYTTNPFQVPVQLHSTVHVLFLSQVLLHPCIETSLIQDVKRPLQKLLMCRRLRKKPVVTLSETHASSDKHQSQDSCYGKHCGCGFMSVLWTALLPNSNMSTAHCDDHVMEEVTKTHDSTNL